MSPRPVPPLTTKQVRQLAAYLPVTLARRILYQGLPTPGHPRPLAAATLFSDISGFTGMSEELASDGPRGAEELNRVLLMTFTAMIDVIHQMGGEVSHFYGDAMSVYFPDNDNQASQRALACAQMMQRLMLTSFHRLVTNRPPDKDPFFELTIKIGLGYGLCQEIVVGDPADNLEFVLMGTAVDEAATAEKQASSGQIIASRAILEKCGQPAPADYNLVASSHFNMRSAALILDWEQIDEAAYQKLAQVAPAFVHRALARRLLTSGASENLAEHRPVTSLFVQFELEQPTNNATAVSGQQLQQYYQWACSVVARFGHENARVNRLLTGDKGNQLHIIFGAPVAPDGPDQAIRCALALQKQKPAFVKQQRIGLAVGKVFAGPVGSAARQEYTVVGDVVNLSARLMQLGQAGQVLTNQATAERTQLWFNFDSLPPVQLKGKQIAITPHLPISERAAATHLHAFIQRWQRPLIGRQAELDQLQASMDHALAGHGRVVGLSGATGVGKSRLTAAAAQYWLDANGLGLLGISYPHTADTPYSLWHGVWQGLFGLTTAMDVDEQITAVRERMGLLAPGWEEEIGLWGEVLGLPIPQSAQLANLTPEARQVRFFNLVQRCFAAQARQRPLLFILEGLHWADQASLALLDELTGRISHMPIFFCITFRPEANLQLATFGRSLYSLLRIAELAPDPARQLLAQLTGLEELPIAIERHLGLRDRDGRESPVNPLFLEEAVRMMEGIGVLQRNGRVQINEALLSQVQVPDTIHGLLLARLDRLPESERDLLQVASVIGRQFAIAPLTMLADTPTFDTTKQMLVNLSLAEMTRLIQSAPDWIYLFQHAMTHEVAYESLPFVRRQLLHATIADWIVQSNEANLKPFYSLLAYHYGRAANDSKGLEYALKAAHAARDIFANQEAVDLYSQAEHHLKALADAGLWQTAVDIYLSRSNCLIRLGNLDTAFQDASNALALAETHQTIASMAQSRNLMAQIRYRQGDYEAVVTLTQPLINNPSGTIPADQLASAYTWAGWAASSQTHYDLALDHLSQAEQICLTENNNFHLALVMEAKSYTYYLRKEMELSLAAMQKSVSLSRQFSTPINLGFALSNIGFVQYMLGQYEEAVTTFDEAVTIGRDSGRNLLVPALCNRGAALCGNGRFTRARVDFEEAIDLLQTMNYPSLQVETHLFWGFEYYCALEEWDQAQNQFDQVQALINTQPDSYHEETVRLLLGQGYVALKKQQPAHAEALLQEAAGRITEKEFAWWQPVVDYFLGLLRLQQGQPSQAAQYFWAGLKASEAGGSPDYKGLLWLQLALLEVGGKQANYLEQAVLAAHRRSRYQDRLVCLHEAGIRLIKMESPHWQQLGQRYLDEAMALEAIDLA